MGRRSDFKRRPHDAYQTIDPRAVQALKPYLNGVRTFAEPCVGQGELLRQLKDTGLMCVLACDILEGIDALQLPNFNGCDAIITNPPWTRQLLHPMILHFQQVAPTWLLFDADWAFNKHAAPFLDQCSDIVAIGRLRWMEGSKTSGKDNAAWYRFDDWHNGGPRFHGRR